VCVRARGACVLAFAHACMHASEQRERERRLGLDLFPVVGLPEVIVWAR